MVETIGAPEGGSYEFDARAIGVGAAAVALRAGAGTLPAVAGAAELREPHRLARYLENVAEGKRSDGTWFVSRLAVYPAASTQGAMCR